MRHVFQFDVLRHLRFVSCVMSLLCVEVFHDVVCACLACDVHMSVFYVSRCGWVGGRPTLFVCVSFPTQPSVFPSPGDL